VALNSGDIDDDCYCVANTDAECLDCLGTCKYTDGDTVNPAYIGDDNGLTNQCSGTSRLGCDECGACDGSGETNWTYYADTDGDGFGDSAVPTIQAGCTQPAVASGSVYDNTDVDDTCACLINSAESLSAGGSCRDDLGNCHGDGYTANCTDITYIFNNYPETMKCDAMDCGGTAGGTDTFGYYFRDRDGDGIGLANKGYRCSSDIEGLSAIPGDIDDNFFCEANIIDECSICDGTNLKISSCENPAYDNQVDCETSLDYHMQGFHMNLSLN
jgi:hypothetical protein